MVVSGANIFLNFTFLGIHERFQNGRENRRQSRETRFLRRTLIGLCIIAGLWKPRGWRLLHCFILSTVCLFQLGIQLDGVTTHFDPSNDWDQEPVEFPANIIYRKSRNLTTSDITLAHLRDVGFTLSSIGSTMSYFMLLYCFLMKVRRLDNCALAPWEAIEDLDLKKLRIFMLMILIVLAIYLVCLANYLLNRNWLAHAKCTGTVCLTRIGIISHFISHFLALVGCLVFTISAIALGTLASDTLRRIHEARASLDALIQIHEELCCIVFETVSAYAPWFLVHWLIYASTIIVSLVYVTIMYVEEHEWNQPVVAFYALATVNYLFMFLIPCFSAAYVTSKCGGIPYRINKTTSQHWPLNHPFQERTHIHLFTTYAKDRQCVFKIGRITFTSTIAWISLLLASVGLGLRLIK